ncbi:hypothetical protein OpiT1DRAFT_06007 [Opitutaceae bacterium TAV1]|nr:hypothetical protein OpiT1DRAFT_06007 [Opitutaceae bacterium TAV1]
MKLQAPPYGEIIVTGSEEASHELDSGRLATFAKAWPQSWPTYRKILEGLFSDYEHDNLLNKKEKRLLIEKIAAREILDGADLLLRFSFDDTGITWDIFQKGRKIVHAQPVF